MRFEEMQLARVYKELDTRGFPGLVGKVALKDRGGAAVRVKNYRILEVDRRNAFQRLFNRPNNSNEPLIIAWVELETLVAWVWGAFYVLDDDTNEWIGAFPVMHRHVMDGFSLYNIIAVACEPTL